MVEQIPLKVTMRLLDRPAIMAFGNPILDIIYVLNNGNGILDKYKLKIDDQMELPEETLQQLIEDLPSESRKKVSAGGCALNTLRILQWLSRRPNKPNTPSLGLYFGGIGKDERGSMLRKLVDEIGIEANYAEHPTLATGVCVSLVTGSSRTLVANLGAANVYTLEDFRKCVLLCNSIKIIYIEGFFAVHSLDVAKDLVQIAQKRNIIIAFNLNGTYIFKEHHAAICEMVGLSKIVFGNASEMMALAQALNLKFEDVSDIPFLLNNLKRVSVDISNTISKDWLASDGIFVMTQGGTSSAIVVWGQGQSAQVEPIVPTDPIIDTTGAGDALVAGFLAGVLARYDVKTCLELGCKLASFIITQLGVTLPDNVPSELLQW